MEMQALQLAYVSILLCLFLTVENSLPRRKAFYPCKSSWGTFSPQNNWLKLIEQKSGKLPSKCFMHVDRPTLCLSRPWVWWLLAGHTCMFKRHIKDHMKKILYFHKCIQYMLGEVPPLYSCLHHVAACIYIIILFVIFTQALSANIQKEKNTFSFHQNKNINS